MAVSFHAAGAFSPCSCSKRMAAALRACALPRTGCVARLLAAVVFGGFASTVQILLLGVHAGECLLTSPIVYGALARPEPHPPRVEFTRVAVGTSIRAPLQVVEI